MLKQNISQRFDDALADAGMDSMLSGATIKKWANNEHKFPLGFPMKALFFMMPENLSDNKRDKIFATLQTYLSNLPRKSLHSKTPLQASHEQKHEVPHYMVDMYSYDDYAEDLHNANGLMPHDTEKAYVAYEQLIQRFLDEKVPVFTAFRIFCNAGLCAMMQNNGSSDVLGYELVHASLRLNPLYDLGRKQKERCIDPLFEPSRMPKKDRAFIKLLASVIEENGQRLYKRTIFRKYEKFLEEIGVSLKYKTVTTPTIFQKEGDGSIKRVGRNDPCYCGSGKKFKKCCDA